MGSRSGTSSSTPDGQSRYLCVKIDIRPEIHTRRISGTVPSWLVLTLDDEFVRAYRDNRR